MRGLQLCDKLNADSYKWKETCYRYDPPPPGLQKHSLVGAAHHYKRKNTNSSFRPRSMQVEVFSNLSFTWPNSASPTWTHSNIHTTAKPINLFFLLFSHIYVTSYLTCSSSFYRVNVNKIRPLWSWTSRRALNQMMFHLLFFYWNCIAPFNFRTTLGHL